MRTLLLELKVKKIISCYESTGIPLHQECPFGKTEIDTQCNICVRKNEKIVEIKTEKETQYIFKGWKKELFKILFRGK